MDIFQMSLSASVLIVAVVIIRAFTLNKLPKKTFLVLWGVVLCRLLIPFSVPSRFSFYTGIAMVKRMSADKTVITYPTESIIPDMTNLPGVGEPMGVSAPAAAISPLEIVWLAGIFACALFFIVAYVKCRREFKMSLPVENSFTALWLREHTLLRPVQIRQNDRIKAPLTYGVFRPVVLLPKTTDWTDETRLRYILAHEYAHIRYFDTLTKLILTAAVCVHWFNPLVWVMFMLANRDIELSCDETVIRTFGETIKSAYALTLIGMEEKKGHITPLVNNFSKNAIEERIVSIMKIKRLSLVGIILALALVISTTTVFATNAKNATYDKPEETNPAPAPVGTVVTTPTDSPQNGLMESGTGGSTVGQTNSATKEASAPKIPAPASDNASNDAENKAHEGYPVNKNGETYGNTALRQTLGLEYDADLMEAIGINAKSGYIRKTDIMLYPRPTTREEVTAYMEYMRKNSHTIPLYDQEGNVIGEFAPAYVLTDKDDNSYSGYAVNKNGETYGNALIRRDLGLDYDPDLIAALGTEGQSGYIRERDQPGSHIVVNTPEDVAKYIEYMKTLPSVIMIPLYDQEGNVIGEFKTSNSYGEGNQPKHYDSLEEAREAVANGDYLN